MKIQKCNDCKIKETCGQFIKGKTCHFMLPLKEEREGEQNKMNEKEYRYCKLKNIGIPHDNQMGRLLSEDRLLNPHLDIVPHLPDDCIRLHWIAKPGVAIVENVMGDDL